MSALQMLEDLTRHGVILEADGGQLIYEAPADVLTPEVLEAIRANKPQLLELLRRPSRRTSAQPDGPALQALLEATAAAGHPTIPGLIRLSSRLVILLRAAELEVGHSLTLTGQRRRCTKECCS